MNYPIPPELFITQLTEENEKLKKELQQAEQDLKDFEILALEWKDNYKKRERELNIKITHLEQTLEDLRNELLESQELKDWNEE